MKFEHEVPVWEAYIENDLCEEERNRVDDTAQRDAAYRTDFEEFKKKYADKKASWKEQISQSRKRQQINRRTRKWLLVLLTLVLTVVLWKVFGEQRITAKTGVSVGSAASGNSISKEIPSAADTPQNIAETNKSNNTSPDKVRGSSIQPKQKPSIRLKRNAGQTKKDSVHLDSVSVKTQKNTDVALVVLESMSAGEDTMSLSSWILIMDDLSDSYKGKTVSQAYTNKVLELYMAQNYDSLLDITKNLEKNNNNVVNYTSLFVKALTHFRQDNFEESKKILVYLDTCHSTKSDYRNEIKWNLMLLSLITNDKDNFCIYYQYITAYYPQLVSNRYEERMAIIQKVMRQKGFKC